MNHLEFMNQKCPRELIGDYIFDKSSLKDGQIVVGGSSQNFYLIRIKNGQPELSRLVTGEEHWKSALGYELHEYLGRKLELNQAQDL